MKPIDPKALHPYIDVDDKGLPPQEQTTWYFRPLDVRERAFIENSAVGVTVDLVEASGGGADRMERDVQQRDGDVRLWRVRLSLAKADNYDVRLTSVPHPLDPSKPPVPSDEFLSTIPPEAFRRMAAFVARLGRVSVAEGKPSPDSSTGSSTDPSQPTAASSAPGEPQPADATE